MGIVVFWCAGFDAGQFLFAVSFKETESELLNSLKGTYCSFKETSGAVGGGGVQLQPPIII